MADKKISALDGATIPLTGTEVLPIVQSGATVKVATNDLTVKNVRSNATTGILQVAGPGTAATRVMTTPDANFTVARIDAAQSFTGDQTLSTGNLIIGTSGKGIQGTTTNDNAAAGVVGEFISGQLAAAGNSLTTSTTTNVISISLTAGDWDVTGIVGFTLPASTSTTYRLAGISTTSATIGVQGTYIDENTAATVTGGGFQLIPPTVRISIASTTTVYLVCYLIFSISTAQYYGNISARRVR